MKKSLRRIWARIPLLDLIGGVVVAALMAIVLRLFEVTPPSDPLKDVAVGVAGLAGLVATAEVFACTAMYSSQSERLQQIRTDNVQALARNWTICLVGAAGSATLSLLSLFVIEQDVQFGMALIAGCLTLTSLGFYRAIHWLRFTLFYEAVDQRDKKVDMYKGLKSRPSNMS